MSNCEQIAQVAQEKWAIVSDMLRSIRTNDQIAQFFEQITDFLFRSPKMSDSLKKIVFEKFFKFKKAKVLIIPSERFAQVAQK